MKLIYLEVRIMTNSQELKFNVIENTEAIVGIHIAKNVLTMLNFKNVIIGMEPTGSHVQDIYKK